MKAFRIFIFALLMVFLSACNLPLESPTTENPITNSPLQSSPIPQSPTKPPPATKISKPSDHHIGVRVVNGVGEFYNRETGEKFVPAV